MSSEALERAERIRENISHVARGCRSASSHSPAPYLNSIEAALVALLAEVERLEQERDEKAGRDAVRRLTVTTSDSYIYDPARVRALYEQLLPDPDLYGDEPVYAVFAYLKDSMYGADVFEAQGDWGEWVEKDEEYDPDA